MAPKLTDEMRQALLESPDRPLQIEDDQTQKVYLLVPQDDFQHWMDAELRRELQIGFDQADAGDVTDWDVEALLREARTRQIVEPE
ncbi:hypothetical protein V6x_23350 [Gimesia chilikensis]|uniref:Uncharacterized protein n=1 Tax=Gimesia chilikensis TaxID=2605989 RepID=A0A517WBK5_9PLAN|nr:hypothetical protein [Gimesia chilikensis]QDU02630.1 hypothetical protein V6x_23350 [Gimesia chilikensis]